METRILKLTLALAIIIVAGYTAYSSQAETQLSGITLENAEALASGENVGGGISCAYGDYDPFGIFVYTCECNGTWKMLKVTGHGICD